MALENSVYAPQWDRIGIVLSSVCIVHCLAMPVLTIALSVFGIGLFREEFFHQGLLLLLAGTGLFAFITGVGRHKEWLVAVLAVVGFSGVIFAAFFAHETFGHTWETPINIAGSSFLLGAHFLNHQRNKAYHENCNGRCE